MISSDQVDEIIQLDQGAPGTFGQFVRMFSTQGIERIEQIAAAVKRRDWLETGGVAHALKGSSASLGAARFADLCRVIEQASRAQEVATVIAAAAHLTQSHGEAIAALQALDPRAASVSG